MIDVVFVLNSRFAQLGGDNGAALEVDTYVYAAFKGAALPGVRAKAYYCYYYHYKWNGYPYPPIRRKAEPAPLIHKRAALHGLCSSRSGNRLDCGSFFRDDFRGHFRNLRGSFCGSGLSGNRLSCGSFCGSGGFSRGLLFFQRKLFFPYFILPDLRLLRALVRRSFLVIGFTFTHITPPRTHAR